MSRSPERTMDMSSPALSVPKNPTRMSAVSILPCNQQNASVLAQRRLPLPICSDRVSSSKWLCGSVKPPRTVLTPPIGHTIKTSAASSQLNGAMLRHQPPAIDIRSANASPAQSKLSTASTGRKTAPATDNTRYSPPQPPQTPSDYVSSNTAMDRSPTPPKPANLPRDAKLAADKKSKHKLTKQVIHKVIERERRRKCSEIITAMRRQFLPDLDLEVSSNSHKSVVPRNIVLEYSYAHIVCLTRKCARLDRRWKRERDQRVSRREGDRSRGRSTTAQPRIERSRDGSPRVVGSRDTPPVSSSSSSTTRRRVELEESSSNETESRRPYRYGRRSPDRLRHPSNRSSTWQADVAAEIREFVEKRKRAYREAEEIPGRKRKRSESNGTVVAEGD